jgi:hypothetical protein
MRKYVAHAMAVTAVAGAILMSAAAPAAAQNNVDAYSQHVVECAVWLATGDPRYVQNCTPSHVLASYRSLSEPGDFYEQLVVKCTKKWCGCEHDYDESPS